MNDEILQKLMKSIETSNKKTVEEANNKQTQDIKNYINKEIIELKTKFEEELERKAKEYEIKFTELKVKYGKLEKELRKNNIIIFGLEAPTEDLVNFVVDILNQYLEVGLKIEHINNAYTIGKQSHRKPIIVKFVSYITKQNILKSCKKLKGTNISIGEELTLEERKENKILRQHLKKARENKLNAFIKQKKLVVNGHEYTAQELAEEEESADDEDSLTNNKEEQDIITLPEEAHSALATPNLGRQKFKEAEQEAQNEEVFEIQKKSYLNKIKIVTGNNPQQKIRSSARLLSLGEKEKETDKKKL